MGNKCICWLRGSTDRQEIESQRDELTTLATTKYGFLKEDIIYIGKAGASAIKQNELYQKEVDELITTLEKDTSIKVCFVWEISRLARVELAFYKMKDFFVKNKIQLICCTPKIELFDADGKINQGTEITLSLLITLAKQEMDIKKERFRRGRDRNRKEMKWNGGGYGALYGYEVNPDGYIVPNQEETDIVRKIFRLYSTGNYSAAKLAKEFNERGITQRNGVKFTTRKIQHILSNKAYKGDNGIRKFPQIIDEELWNSVADIRKQNDATDRKATKETKHINFGVQHLKCKECGGNMFVLNTRYKCYKHHIKECSCKDSIDSRIFDNLIWDVAQLEHIEFLHGEGEKSIETYEANKKIVKEKILETNNKLAQLEERKFRAQDLYMAGDINKARYESQLGKIKIDFISYQADLERYNEEIERIDNIIYQIQNPTPDSFVGLVADVQDEKDRKVIKDIINQHIGLCSIEKGELFNHKGTIIRINTVKGIEHKFIFMYGAHKVYKYNSFDDKWIDYYPPHEEMKKKAEEVFESMGTTLEEITQDMINEERIADILNDDNLTDNEKTFMISVILGRDIRDE